MKKLTFIVLLFLISTTLVACGNQEDTVRFNSEEAAAENQDSNQPAEENSASVPESSEVDWEDQIEFDAMKEGVLKTDLSYNLITGKVPQGTNVVKVNDYTLQRFEPGDKIFSYIVSTDIGNLKEGVNNFEFSALDADGQVIDSRTLEIDYQSTVAARPTALTQVGMNSSFIVVLSLALSTLYFLFFKRRSSEMNL